MKPLYIILSNFMILSLLNVCTTTTNITTNVRLPHDYKNREGDIASTKLTCSGGKNCSSPPFKKEPSKENQEEQETNVVEPDETANQDFSEEGLASWYGRDFDGKTTANGETFDSTKLSAAHKTIPLGSTIVVKNLENNKEVKVVVNDRGPYIEGRILDLSEKGAEELGYKQDGLTHVAIKVLSSPSKKVSYEGKGATYNYFQEAKFEGGKGEGMLTSESDVDEGQNVYSVQVGTFSEMRLAKKLEERLEPFKEPVKIIKRGSLYIVRAGAYKNQNSATQLKNKLKKAGYSAFVMSPY